MDPEADAKADAAFEALSSWYDNALGAGAGFKSEEERQAYIKSLGDPLKHPMFATSTEDLEGHPLTEAFRCLREEDKTLLELAEMYKEEGNDWIKKGNKQSYTEAYGRYSHALGFIDKAIAERGPVGPDSTVVEIGYEKIKSQIIGNRAQACLLLTNYGSCRRDCDISIRLWPANIKSHYRRCKALHMLKYYKECLKACAEALLLEPENKDILAIQTKCSEEFNKRRNDRIETHKRLTESLHAKWSGVWDVARKDGATLGYFPISYLEPQQLRDTFAHIDTESNCGSWPLLMMYPQYSNFDIIQAAPSVDMLVDHMAVLFPEKGDYEQRIEWDLNEEYQASNIVVYLPLNVVEKVTTKEQWLQSCTEHHIVLKGDNTILPLVEDADGNLNNSFTTVEEVKTAAVAREKAFEESSKKLSKKKAFLEVHLGCTIQRVLKATNHVVGGGILTFIVFPKNNAAHKVFLSEGSSITVLNPV